jgi:hypothetical protein
MLLSMRPLNSRGGKKISVRLGKNEINGTDCAGAGLFAWGRVVVYGCSLRSLVWMTFAAQLICLGIGFFLIEPQRHKIEHTNIYKNLGEAIKLFKTNPRLRLVTIANAIQFGIGDAQYRFAPAFFQTVLGSVACGEFKCYSECFWGHRILGFWSGYQTIRGT